MTMTAKEILTDWETFLSAWDEHAEENELTPFDPNDETQKPTVDYLDFLADYDEWSDDQAPEFVTELGHSALSGLAANDVEFFDRDEWKEVVDDQITESTGIGLNEWPLMHLDMDAVYDDQESEWTVITVEGTDYYYEG